MPNPPIDDIDSLTDELCKWQAEGHDVSVALTMPAGEFAISLLFVTGKITGTPWLKLEVMGSSCAASVSLADARFDTDGAEEWMAGIGKLPGFAPLSWTEVIVLEFPSGNVLLIWRPNQRASTPAKTA